MPTPNAASSWNRAGEYHIVRGAFTISRASVRGDNKYLLWEGETLRGMFLTAEDAKRAAEVFERMGRP